MSIVGFMKKLLQKPAAAVIEEKVTEQSIEAVNAPDICSYEYRFLNAPIGKNEIRVILLQESGAKSILYDSNAETGRRITPNELQMLKEMAFGSIMNNKNEPPSSKFHIMRSPRAQLVISRAFTIALRSKSQTTAARTVDGAGDPSQNSSMQTSMNSITAPATASPNCVMRPTYSTNISRRCSTDSDYVGSTNTNGEQRTARVNSQPVRPNGIAVHTPSTPARTQHTPSINSTVKCTTPQQAPAISLTKQDGATTWMSESTNSKTSVATTLRAASVERRSDAQSIAVGCRVEQLGSTQSQSQANASVTEQPDSINGSANRLGTHLNSVTVTPRGVKPGNGTGERQRVRVAVSVLIACDSCGEQLDTFMHANAARVDWTVKHFSSWFDLLVSARLTAPRRCGKVDDRAALRCSVVELATCLNTFVRAPRLRLAWHRALVCADNAELHCVLAKSTSGPTQCANSNSEGEHSRSRASSQVDPTKLSSTSPITNAPRRSNSLQQRLDAAETFMRQFDALFTEYERRNRLLSTAVSGVLVHHRTWLSESTLHSDAATSRVRVRVLDAFGNNDAANRIVLYDESSHTVARFAEFLTYFVRVHLRLARPSKRQAAIGCVLSTPQTYRARMVSETSLESGCGSECTVRDADAEPDDAPDGRTSTDEEQTDLDGGCECESESASSEPPVDRSAPSAAISPSALGVRIRSVQRPTGSAWPDRACLVELQIDNASLSEPQPQLQYDDAEWSVHAHAVASEIYVPLVPLLCTTDREIYEKARAEVRLAHAAARRDRRLVRVNVLVCDLARAEVMLLRSPNQHTHAPVAVANADAAANFRLYLDARKRVGNQTSARGSGSGSGSSNGDGSADSDIRERILTAAPTVTRTLDALYQLGRARLPADYCVRFLESKLVELAHRSRTVLRLTDSVRQRMLRDPLTSAFQSAALRSQRHPHTLLSAVSKLTGIDTIDLEFMLQLAADR